ncbi:RloB family protein [Streptomyces otsuchiensis]|uniref:RloB family protein n=1 Tax=Streptomyces otsuchiensis TaxID=2681388 RepID=UPI0010303175|nr:RloB family protein [Streptomyces otsuchiensis]
MGRRPKELGRAGRRSPEKRRVLVYCEDECAGRQYFLGLRAELRYHPVQIAIGDGCGEPLGLVRDAIAHRKRAPTSPADRRSGYDEVWCVIDVESPPHARLHEALALARGENIRVALTNPCFDLWILLHFSDVTAHVLPQAIQKRIETETACGFTARRKHLRFEALEGRHDGAAERAQSIRARAESVGRAGPLLANPWVEVDLMVAEPRRR